MEGAKVSEQKENDIKLFCKLEKDLKEKISIISFSVYT